MLRRQTIFKALSLTLILLTFVACDKTNGLEVKTAEFSVNHESVYLTKSVTFTAKDSLGGNEYSWDFGDGSTVIGKYNATHTYEKGGIYLASMTINGYKSEKAINVYKGTLSFRIVNKSSKYFECLTYIDNYSGSVSRFLVDPKSQSDTIYGANLNNGDQHIFGVSFFIENSEYTLPNIIWVKDFQHYDILVTDTTMVTPRSSHGIPNSIMIKDL
jgi:PKD domain